MNWIVTVLRKIRRVIDGTDPKYGLTFDIIIQSIILFSIITFSIETLPGLEPETIQILDSIENVILILFTIEYVLRVVVSTKRMSYIFSFYGIIDLLAILPFYISMGIDLRTIRALRFLRMFMIMKLTKYNAAARRFALALKIAREEIVMFIFVSATMMYMSAVGIYYFENEAQPEAFASVFHSLWWSVITLTTVGYGDVYPITVGGRLFTLCILLIGVGIISVPSGLIAAALNQARRVEEEQKLHKRKHS